MIALVLPLVIFTAPAVVGRAFLDGDNFLQNYPMRALVGNDLAHGWLPLLNPYIFSGTPLLGGFNAGAAYPGTWLFAILPNQVAWPIDVSLTYDVALAGMYLFLRRQPLSSTAATFGAVTFAFGGYMAGQIVHIDLVTGAAWLPWMLWAIHALTSRPAPARLPPDQRAQARRHGRWWAGALAVSLGMSMLAGAPEAIIDAAVAVGIYTVGRLISEGLLLRRNWPALSRSVVTIGCGAVGGALLSAAQWLPGLVFTSQSQRSVPNYQFFTSGSLPRQVTPMLASPFLFGSNQARGVPYVGTYSYPEVAGYVGILALIAACALLAGRWRRRPEARHWWVWYPMLVIGMLSALGGQTPFGQLMFIVPGVNAERLLNRNLLLVDFALAALSAWWVHLLLDSRHPAEGPAPPSPARPAPDGPWRPGRRVETVLTCLPLAVVSVLAVLAWVWGARLELALSARYTPRLSIRLFIDGLVAAGVLIAGVATWVALNERRFPARKVRRMLSAVLVIDLAFFVAFTVRPPVVTTQAQAQGAEAVRFASLVGDGRFLIYDPDNYQFLDLHALGQTDLNLFAQVESGQGYAALVGNDYYLATGAHYLGTLDPTTLATSTWDELNVHVLISLPSYFVTPAEANFAGQGGIPFPLDPSSYVGAPTPTVNRVPLASGQSHRWYFGGTLSLDTASIPLPAGVSGNQRIGLVAPTGGTRWLPSSEVAMGKAGGSGSGSLTIKLASPTMAAGLVVENTGPHPTSVGIPEIQTADGGDFKLDGRLQYGVNGSHWKFTGTIGAFGIFVNTRAKGWAWATSTTGRSPAAGTTVATRSPDSHGTQRITVDAAGPVDVVRSVAWAPGWHATIQPVGGGPAVEIPIEADQPVQRIAIPGAGRYVVTFTYRPTDALVGIGVSAVTVVALAAGVAWALWAGRRRRRDGRQPPAA